jgi:hypothetical protein
LVGSSKVSAINGGWVIDNIEPDIIEELELSVHTAIVVSEFWVIDDFLEWQERLSVGVGAGQSGGPVMSKVFGRSVSEAVEEPRAAST